MRGWVGVHATYSETTVMVMIFPRDRVTDEHSTAVVSKYCAVASVHSLI
jgi:hypothetical protein